MKLLMRHEAEYIERSEKSVLDGDYSAVLINRTEDGGLRVEFGSYYGEPDDFMLCKPEVKTTTVELFPEGDTQRVDLGDSLSWKIR